ncbi:MAG: SLC13 family permease [Bacteroidota bacterium]
MKAQQLIFLLLGPLLFVGVGYFIPFEGLANEGRMLLAGTCWIAVWWVSEVIPIGVTSLLPLILFPISGATSMEEATLPYANKLLYLFIGGFMLARAMEEWRLHERIALNIVVRLGGSLHSVILGFMLATALLSMWISNTATTVLMLPIALALISQLIEQGEGVDKNFGKALILAIAYSASIGGLATLVGTPTNLIFVGAAEKYLQTDISFVKWMGVGMPASVLLIGFLWQYLVRVAFKLENISLSAGKANIKKKLTTLGKIGWEEKWILALFIGVAIAWIIRKYVLNLFLPQLNDTHIILIGIFPLFFIPAKAKDGALLSWQKAVQIPWDVILLFGAGFSIAAGFQSSGLATWLGERMVGISSLPPWLVLILLITFVNFLTEITSNMATCTLMMPLLAELGPAIGMNPIALMVGACLASSCAFMLPVATAPNAISFGSGLYTIPDMIRTGFWLNIVSILVIFCLIYFVMPVVWGIEL